MIHTEQDYLISDISWVVDVFQHSPTQADNLISNVFSPNGDGKNDSFKVTGLAVDEFSMVIYNRWGQEVYAGTNASVGWNGGLDNSANKVPDGTYFYIITFKDRCSTPPVIEEKGHVTLVR